MSRHLSSLLLASVLLLAGCIDRYTPDVPPAARHYLVVDGFINAQGSTVIKLSRTYSLGTANSTPPAESRARLYLQDNTGQRYPLTEGVAGTYASAAQALDPARHYQLHLTTADGREYATDPTPVKVAPPVDKLSWKSNADQGITVYVDSHDATGTSRYYRWDYEETWKFTTAFWSAADFVPRPAPRQDTVVYTQIDKYHCWQSSVSTAIRQTSTTSLAADVVAAFPVVVVPPFEKLRYGYSVLVRQYAQTQAEYDYWELLRKNTENLGTVNDPLPARLSGNVHCLSDASEQVVGYVGAHTVTEKRLYVDYNDLPVPAPVIRIESIYDKCDLTTYTVANGLREFRAGRAVPVGIIIGQNGLTVGYTGSNIECVDCRLRGTNVKPSFWP